MPYPLTRLFARPRSFMLAASAPALVASMGCQPASTAEVDLAPPPPAYRPAASTVLRADLETPPQAPTRSAEPVEITAGANTPVDFGGDLGPAPAAESSRTYTIQKGDKLWNIAKREYGSGQRWVDIAEANPDINPDKLPIGLTIVLP
ncbi:MAG: LysM peptidoglycan-binding domain-containing protein [Planctomycetota bacterium]